MLIPQIVHKLSTLKAITQANARAFVKLAQVRWLVFTAGS